MAAPQVEAFADLDALAREDGEALGRSRQSSLYDRLSWWRLTRDHIGGIDPLVIRARTQAATAWLPLSRRGKALLPLGSWYTLAFAPVFDGPAREQHALLAAIARSLRNVAPLVTLWPLDEPSAGRVATCLREAGWQVRTAATSANWTADVSGGWAAYWASRPSRLRNTAERKRRRTPLTFELHTRFDSTLWDEFEAVFAASWKPAEGSPAFLRALAEQEGAAGTLRLALGRRGGEAVAAQLWLVESGIATLHKLAHRTDADVLSPGTLLTAATIEALITRDRVGLLDFGTGDDQYKADWADTRRPLFTLEAASPGTLIGLARVLRWRLRVLVRRLRLA